MFRKSLITAAVCAVALAGTGVGIASAGEVTGNGGTPAAPAHANSICAFSGLNDYITGQAVLRTQTPRDGYLFYGTPHGIAGIACRGGSNV